MAGLKHLRVHRSVYRRPTSVGNHTRGFWLDYDNAAILVEEALWCQNLTDGIFIEANQGRIVIRNSTICDNQKGDRILATNSRDVVLEHNIMYGNGRAQIRLTGDPQGSLANWETGETIFLTLERWSVQDNVIVGTESSQLLRDTVGWNHLLDSLTSRGNLCYHPTNPRGVRIARTELDFAAWRARTGQDFDSVFVDPRLTAPEAFRLTPPPDSPFWNNAPWEQLGKGLR